MGDLWLDEPGPELLDPRSSRSNGRSTREFDCYALDTFIYNVGLLGSSQQSLVYAFQVLTGVKPFHDMPDLTCVLDVLRGERPSKPPHAESLGLSDILWGSIMMQLCWSETT